MLIKEYICFYILKYLNTIIKILKKYHKALLIKYYKHYKVWFFTSRTSFGVSYKNF